MKERIKQVLEWILIAPIVAMVWLLMKAYEHECPECRTELYGRRHGRCPECHYAFDEYGDLQNQLDRIESGL